MVFGDALNLLYLDTAAEIVDLLLRILLIPLERLLLFLAAVTARNRAIAHDAALHHFEIDIVH
jgi:Arc/MetJ family transcription regulator